MLAISPMAQSKGHNQQVFLILEDPDFFVFGGGRHPSANKTSRKRQLHKLKHSNNDVTCVWNKRNLMIFKVEGYFCPPQV